MSRQLAALVAEKVLLTPANVVRGLPVKSVAAEIAAKPSPYGKLGWKNWWPTPYTSFNPRLPPHAYTLMQRLRTAHWRHLWEYDPFMRFLIYAHILTIAFGYWVDKNIMRKEETVTTLTAMVYDDLKEQRQALYQHVQKHHDHAYFKHKGCHDGHPMGHGISDPHVF